MPRTQATPAANGTPPPPRGASASRDKRTPKEWLDEFDSVDETQLADNQRRFVAAFRLQYSEGRAGIRRRDGRLYFYASDVKLGYFAGLIPEKQANDEAKR